MKKITAFVGSARKKHTYNAARQFLDNLQSFDDIEYEIVSLSDYRIETCIGCKVCFEKGEEFCPLKDDRDILIEKIEASDGVVFASPNYAFHVSAIMKTFLDRTAFILHRPRFFGKTCTSIVAQGIYRGEKIVKYLDFVSNAMGFNIVKGSCIKSLEPMTDKAQQKTDQTLAKHSQRFYKKLMQPAYPAPKLFEVMIFRMSRTSMHLMLDENSRDYTYYRDQGWFESDFYYPARLGPVKAGVGKLFDALSARMSTTR
jgi:multimeric flavodoxin WrbA